MPAVGFAEMMFRAPIVVPPIVTPGCAAHDHPEGPVADGLGTGGIGADPVTHDQDSARGGPRDRHARLCVARDHVARALRCAADRDTRGVDRHARARVAQGLGSRLVGTDEVALDHGIRRGGVDDDAVARVARDHVASQADRPTDGGARPPGDDDAAGQVAHRGGALDVGADQVVGDVGRCHRRARDQHPFRVPGNKVTPPRDGRANRIEYGTIVNQNAGTLVANGDRSRLVEPDQVALNERAGRVVDLDAVAGVARDKIARAGRCSADDHRRATAHENTVATVGQSGAPTELVPIQLPAITLALAPMSSTPSPVLAEITLPEPAVVPPMVSPVAPSMIATPASPLPMA